MSSDGAPIELFCQTCGYIPTPGIEYQWYVLDYDFPEGRLQIWTCLSCQTTLTHDQIFNRYKDRIRTGKNVLYH